MHDVHVLCLHVQKLRGGGTKGWQVPSRGELGSYVPAMTKLIEATWATERSATAATATATAPRSSSARTARKSATTDTTVDAADSDSLPVGAEVEDADASGDDACASDEAGAGDAIDESQDHDGESEQ